MAFYFMRIHAQINHVLRQIKQILLSVFCASSKGTAETEATETPSDEILLDPFKIGRKCCYIDKGRKMAIKQKFKDAQWFQEGLEMIKLGHQREYIDKNGKRVIKQQF